MNEKPGLSDEAIRALLEKRAGRPDIAGRLAAARTVAAATPQRRAGRFAWRHGRTPNLVGAAGLTALVLVLVAVGLASRTPSSGTPTGSPLAASGSPGPNLSPLPSEASGPIVLTVDQLNGLIATDLNALSGHLLIIDGVINGIGPLCTVGFGGKCFEPTAYLDRSTPRLAVEPVSALGPGPWSATPAPPFAGAFAATLVSGTLEYRGPVTLTQALVALLPSQLPDPSNAGSGVKSGYWLVHGWISGLGVVPSCPSIPPPASTAPPQYSCGGIGALMSDDARQPVTVTSGGFSVDGGAGSVLVQNGAYQEFAPAPESSGLQTRPEEATFLVQETYVSTCPVGGYCGLDGSNFHWEVVARVDPLQVVVAFPSPSPTPSVSAQPIRPLTVEQVNALSATAPSYPTWLHVVITGTIGYQMPISSCSGSVSACKRSVVLLGSQPTLEVYPIASVRLPSHLPFRGTFAALLGAGQPLNFVGVVTTAVGGSPIMPSQLPARTTSAAPDSLWLVQGWIAGLEAALPCPLAPGSPQTGPQYGCGSTASLSDTHSQPVANLQLTIPADGVQVQNGAYDDFAPDPQSSGYKSQPEQATFLVKLASVPCPPGIFCTVESGHQWQIVARIDPWPVPALP